MTATTAPSQNFFASLNEQEAALLRGIAGMRRYAAGETVFQRGEAGDFMLVLQSGRVRIVLYSEDGKEMTLELREPGDVLGELALLDGAVRSAHAVADSACEALVFERRDLLPLFAAHPALLMKVTTSLTGLLRRNADLIESIALLDLPAKLARLLLRLAARYGRAQDGGTLILDGMNQSDYGQLIATSRESVNKQLRQWQKIDVLECRKDGILIRNFPALLSLAETAE